MTAMPNIPDMKFALDAAQAPRPPAHAMNAERAKQTAQDFEAQFLSQMIGYMFEGIKTDGLFGGGNGEEMFRSMMFDEFGKTLARAGGIGLADAVQREILKAQEA
jgi:peptidoglycan hydrolase FlgJ